MFSRLSSAGYLSRSMPPAGESGERTPPAGAVGGTGIPGPSALEPGSNEQPAADPSHSPPAFGGAGGWGLGVCTQGRGMLCTHTRGGGEGGGAGTWVGTSVTVCLLCAICFKQTGLSRGTGEGAGGAWSRAALGTLLSCGTGRRPPPYLKTSQKCHLPPLQYFAFVFVVVDLFLTQFTIYS